MSAQFVVKKVYVGIGVKAGHVFRINLPGPYPISGSSLPPQFSFDVPIGEHSQLIWSVGQLKDHPPELRIPGTHGYAAKLPVIKGCSATSARWNQVEAWAHELDAISKLPVTGQWERLQLDATSKDYETSYWAVECIAAARRQVDRVNVLRRLAPLKEIRGCGAIALDRALCKIEEPAWLGSVERIGIMFRSLESIADEHEGVIVVNYLEDRLLKGSFEQIDRNAFLDMIEPVIWTSTIPISTRIEIARRVLPLTVSHFKSAEFRVWRFAMKLIKEHPEPRLRSAGASALVAAGVLDKSRFEHILRTYRESTDLDVVNSLGDVLARWHGSNLYKQNNQDK